MKIERQPNGRFVITKAGGYVFCFFVDGESSCWTKKHTYDRRCYGSRVEAEADLAELRLRNREKQRARKRAAIERLRREVAG